MSWKDLKKVPITIVKTIEEKKAGEDDKDSIGGDKNAEGTEKKKEIEPEMTTVMDKDAFDNSPECRAMHLNDAQKELIDDLRSV